MSLPEFLSWGPRDLMFPLKQAFSYKVCTYVYSFLYIFVFISLSFCCCCCSSALVWETVNVYLIMEAHDFPENQPHMFLDVGEASWAFCSHTS